MAATVIPTWKLPPPPQEGAVPAYYLDGSEVWPHWLDPATGEYVEGSDMPWPFEEEAVLGSDFRALGFVDAEDFPLKD